MGKRLGVRWFSREILQKPLYPYQELVAEAILDSILNNKGLTFSIMMSRQSGKNQLSAILEAYLLACMDEGTLVKCAPTFKPQTINSRLRLLAMLDNPLTRDRYWTSYGYILGVAPSPELREAQAGPRIMLFSAGPGASIVGATASLLLEIDEAQDVSAEKFDRDLRPMASTTNATTVLYGTAWSNDTLLAMIKADNLTREEEDGIQRHYQFDWQTLAAINPNYKTFVENEIRRLGEEHVTIRTQYKLLPISGAGLLLNDLQRYLLKGTHDWEEQPDEDDDGVYIAGMDVGGEDRTKEGEEVKRRGRDSTVITIGKIRYNELLLPQIEIVHQLWWTGMHYIEQYAQVIALVEQWGIKTLVVDKTGLGEMMGSLLVTRLGEERVVPFRFSRPSKSHLTYQFLSMLNSGRLKLYRSDEAPVGISEECWKQLRLARSRAPAPGILDMYVDPAEDGHDDFLMSIALTCEAVNGFTLPTQASIIVKPHRLYENEGRF